MANTLVVGAGWLGTPLAENLKKDGHHIVVTRRNQTRLNELPTSLTHSALFDFDQLNAANRLDRLLKQYQITHIVGAFPPGFRKGRRQEYAQQWKMLTNSAKQNNVKKLLMFSSTTVYPNLASDMEETDASLSLAIDSPYFSDNARVMLQAEQHVIDSNISFIIMRCSGLIGPDRHPSRFAMRLKQVSRKAPANMLHQDDAISVAKFSLENLSNQIINVTTPDTVSKAEFYQAAINKCKSEIPLPPITEQMDKRILADKLLSLGYQFHFNSTLDAL